MLHSLYDHNNTLHVAGFRQDHDYAQCLFPLLWERIKAKYPCITCKSSKSYWAGALSEDKDSKVEVAIDPWQRSYDFFFGGLLLQHLPHTTQHSSKTRIKPLFDISVCPDIADILTFNHP